MDRQPPPPPPPDESGKSVTSVPPTGSEKTQSSSRTQPPSAPAPAAKAVAPIQSVPSATPGKQEVGQQGDTAYQKLVASMDKMLPQYIPNVAVQAAQARLLPGWPAAQAVVPPVMAPVMPPVMPQPWGFGAPFQYGLPPPQAPPPPPQGLPQQTLQSPAVTPAPYKAEMPNAGLRGKAASIPGLNAMLAARGM